MKYVGIFFSLLVMLSMGCSWGYTDPEVKEPLPITGNPQQGTGTPTTVYLPLVHTNRFVVPPTQDILADNSVIAQFASIPEAYVKAAAQRRLLFYHQSVGGNIWSFGLNCLAGINFDPANTECTPFAQNPGYYDNTNWNWPVWPTPMADAIAKMDEFVSLVPAQQQSYDFIGMKFCYVDSFSANFEDYRTKMENLEKAYPSKEFIWSTFPLYGKALASCPNCAKLEAFNTQLRAYAKDKHKPLYDIASIESNGGVCKVVGTNYEGLCPEYNSDIAYAEGGHPNNAGSVRLAKGFWWLIARLSGWEP